MDVISGLVMGLSLSAASGFRIFIPFLILSIASLAGWTDALKSSEWIATYPAMIIFGFLSLLEIIGYYCPWIDNMLDLISTPVSIITGTVLASSVMIESDPFSKWVLAILLGGGVALNIQLLTVKARALSSVFSNGKGNQIIASIEIISSIIISILAIVISPLAVILSSSIVYLIYLKIVKQDNVKKT
ncbi:MAG: DUF4126 domain-containing protein [Ignavibacteria bacterium]